MKMLTNSLKSILFLVILLFTQCSGHKKPMKLYTLTLHVMEYNRVGFPFFLDRKRQLLMAENDTVSYIEALKIYYSIKLGEEKLRNAGFSRIQKFELKEGRRKVFDKRSDSTLIINLKRDTWQKISQRPRAGF